MNKYERQIGFVALLDVLGAGKYDIQKSIDFLQYRDYILNALWDVKITYKSIVESYCTIPKVVTFADNVVFSLPVERELDTEHFPCVDQWLRKADTKHFLGVAQWLREAIYYLLKYDILIRGAVSLGEYVTDDKTTIIGPAASYVEKYYESANWLGVIFTPCRIQKRFEYLVESLYSDTDKLRILSRWLVKYPVPMKNCRKPLWVVSWPFELLSDKNVTDPLGELCKYLDNAKCLENKSPDIKEKRLNTIAFFRWYQDEVYPHLDL